MRKRALITLTLLALSLTACGTKNEETGETEYNLRVYKDAVYGCEYVNPDNYEGGLTPRLNAQGKQVGCNK